MRQLARTLLVAILFIILLAAAPESADARAATDANTPTDTNSDIREANVYLHVSSLGQSGESFCGSEARPCSLPIALHRAPPGSVLLLEGGVYFGSFHITKSLTLISKSHSALNHRRGGASSSGMTTSITPADARILPVIFDGEHKNRILWFDNVPARVEGITFRNGQGDGAGCMLITQKGGSQSEGANIIRRCNFYNCSTTRPLGAEAEPALRRVAAGALSIVRERHPIHPSIEISDCTFRDNFGRSYGKAVGALAVHYDNDKPSDVYECSLIVFSQVVARGSGFSRGHDGLENGMLFSRMPNILLNGKPLYRSYDRANKVRKSLANARPLYIMYCQSENRWALISSSPEGAMASPPTDGYADCPEAILSFGCESDGSDCDSILMAVRVYRDGVEMVNIPSRFRCQDIEEECGSVLVEGARGLQAHRNGVYELVKRGRGGLGGRPVFKQTPALTDLAPQFLRYCIATNEWIIGDDDPAVIKEHGQECLRGIASTETLAVHPTLVKSWSYWDVDIWRQSPIPGGITATCAPSVRNEGFCPLLSVVDFPTMVVGIEPTLYLNTTRGSPHSHRPKYVDVAHQIHMWYCLRFREWAISSILPSTLGPSDECVRSFGSSETLETDPRAIKSNWEMFLPTSEWMFLQRGLSIKCSEDCPRIHLEVEWITEDSGVYEAVGRLPNTYHRLYRQVAPPHNIVFFSTDSLKWSVVSSDGALLYSGVSPSVSEKTPLLAVNWTRHDASVISLHMACVTHATCPQINVSSPLPRRATQSALPDGSFTLQHYVVGDRPVYAGKLVAPIVFKGVQHKSGYIFYCAPQRRWVMGPKPAVGSCAHWVAAHPSASHTPHLWTVWRHGEDQLVVTCSGTPSTRKSPPHALVSGSTSSSASSGGGRSESRANPTVTLHPLNVAVTSTSSNRREASHQITLGVSDLISECNFSFNTAFLSSHALATGAISVYHSRIRSGGSLIFVGRGLTFADNEGLSTLLAPLPARNAARPPSVGGLLVTSSAPYTTPLVILNDVSVRRNRGSVGGLYAEAVNLQGTRMALSDNHATLHGGGFAARDANVTFHHIVCAANTGAYEGGCGYTDPHTMLTISHSDIANNSALGVRGTCIAGGVVRIDNSRLRDMYHRAVAASSLAVTNSELSCSVGLLPRSISSGLGCVPDVDGESAVAQEAAAIDTFVGTGRFIESYPSSATLSFSESILRFFQEAVASLRLFIFSYLYTPYFIVPALTYIIFPFVWDFLVRKGVISQRPRGRIGKGGPSSNQRPQAAQQRRRHA